MAIETTKTEQTATAVDRFTTCLEAADFQGLADCYAPDVLLDVNPPLWRFQLQGRDAARAWLTEQMEKFSDLRCTHLRVIPYEGGAMVETEFHVAMDGAEHLWRSLDVVAADGDLITEHVQYCTGLWDTETIERQAAEAPMVRW